MSTQVKQIYLQDKLLDFSQIKYKHSEVFNDLNQYGNQFKDFSVYSQVPIYKYSSKDQMVFLRYTHFGPHKNRVFDIKSKDTDWMFEIMKRKMIMSKHIVEMEFLKNYKISTMFTKKNLAYCFFHIPKNNLQDTISRGEQVKFQGKELESLMVSQVTCQKFFIRKLLIEDHGPF